MLLTSYFSEHLTQKVANVFIKICTVKKWHPLILIALHFLDLQFQSKLKKLSQLILNNIPSSINKTFVLVDFKNQNRGTSFICQDKVNIVIKEILGPQIDELATIVAAKMVQSSAILSSLLSRVQAERNPDVTKIKTSDQDLPMTGKWVREGSTLKYIQRPSIEILSKSIRSRPYMKLDLSTRFQSNYNSPFNQFGFELNIGSWFWQSFGEFWDKVFGIELDNQ